MLGIWQEYTAYPAVSIRRRVGAVEEVVFTSSRSKSICPATLEWALICNEIKPQNNITQSNVMTFI